MLRAVQFQDFRNSKNHFTKLGAPAKLNLVRMVESEIRMPLNAEHDRFSYEGFNANQLWTSYG